MRVTQVPPTTPPTDTLYAAGTFNNWNPRSEGYRLVSKSDGTYQLTFPATVTGALEFKLTRGSWQRAETSAQHDEIENRRAELTGKPGYLDVQVANWKDLGQAGKPCASTAVQPNVQVVNPAFLMPQLGRARRVWVYLPAGYTTSPGQRYPVLYMHDGQNVFDACTSFSGEWGVDETLSQLQQQGLDATGSIVVAVAHGDQERLNELSPWRNPQYGGGQGDAYVDFLVQTLKPYIDATYRTLTGREFTGVAGSSMGGLISTYAALKYPLTYSRVGVFSPAFWFAEDSLRSYIRQVPPKPQGAPTAYYLVAGSKEGETMVPLLLQMAQGLRRPDSLANKVQTLVQADGQHAEWFWKREFPAAYRWLKDQHTGRPGTQELRWAAWLEPGPRQLHIAASQEQAGLRKIELTLYNAAGQRVKRSKQAAGSRLNLSRLPAGTYRLMMEQTGRVVGAQQPATCQQQLILPEPAANK
ncbi:hypothetical protein KBK19_08605 [Microvirga sp. STR05]|uniref:CBM20 domain-containing protein n=1 Tax=Hymenobacter duratus TaxID=2771356 RepID=A0ABR8JHB1_9BACT|nr:alpha/beta hydrolase-fold protein [Hymenobacter duratus]MBD2715093.1 hypothetical protein [Hymenobacter duratus]MBR7949999.1 hypothetical protein [Microvirga sp. STR05]